MKLKETFRVIFMIVISFLAGIIILMSFARSNYHKLTNSSEMRFLKTTLATEIKYASDRRTALCRNYVFSGKSIWKTQYLDAVDIRNGVKPWANGSKISYLDSLNKLDFTIAELNKFKLAAKHADELIKSELKAMNAAEGIFPDSSGNYTVKGQPDFTLAHSLLYDDNYMHRKFLIMSPIDDAINMVNQRTQIEVDRLEKSNLILQSIVLILIILIFITAMISYFVVGKKLILAVHEMKLSKERAELNEYKFKLLFEKAPDPIAITNMKGEFIDCNEAMFKFHNVRDLDELKQFKSSDAFSEPEKRLEIVNEIIKEGFIKNVDLQIYTFKDKEERSCTVSSGILRFTGVEPVLITWMKDITDKNKTDQYIRKLSTAITQSPVAIIITNLNGEIEFVNPQFTKITGWDADEAIGKTPSILKSGDHSIEYYKELWSTIAKGKIWKGEFHNHRKDGSYFWEEATISPIFDDKNKIINYVAIKQDITLKKQFELDLLEKQQQLKDLNKIKDNLFSIIGHDLRGPIGNLKSFIELILTDFDLDDKENLTKTLQILSNSATRAYDLLDNLLLWARSQRNEVIFQPSAVKIYRLADHCISLLSETAKIKEINIINNIDKNLIVNADANMISTIFRNLISNAIKFSRRESDIIISSSTDQANYTITVKDTGVGIKQEDISKLFDDKQLFTTSGTSGEKGTGLGLLICKDFITKHNGTIKVESQPGEGTEFAITIPRE